MAALLSDITGRTVERVVVEDDEWRTAAIERGMPAGAADFTLGMYRAARGEEFAVTDPTLETVIGHRPVPVRTVLEAIVAQR
ncbi:hypothetical protein NIE79_000560 [Micromonospora sp. NIE79]|uniref:NmrA family transcriptional regulator n=1 Tax=Micromonospora trifolii TaxID=2911208 RepID=A0ABS9MYJ3_9ACTN|nr:hypothetical protein [Micromonospora trifolii]MCG5442773.1 hypothetical protein [Micromonospora trifolii]